MAPDPTPTREVAPAAPTPSAPVGRRWAVLVGVSEYRTTELNLQFADRDARELHDLIVTPEGGNFAAENIRLLCNDEATTAEVTRAVRGFLLGAVPDDVVLLYFACHGGPDPRRPSGPLYLFTHDTDPRDVAGTAFAMDEIDRSLQQLVQAQRVVIIADTCHSGGIGAGIGGRAAATAEATNQYLSAMAHAKGGVALLTSAEAAEASFEDAKWGGGHGVFTHHVLEGMRGAADGFGGEKDGIVSVGELFEYVRDQVQKDTDGRQHPAIGSAQFDRKLPMAVTGELDVAQHLALGHRLVEVGWLLDDPAPMLLAAREFGLAADLKRHLPAADATRGTALLAAGHHDEAIAALRSAVGAPDAAELVDPAAWLHLGIALAERGELDDAAVAMGEYRTRVPDSADDPWIKAFLDWRERPPARIRALLIGAGTSPVGSGVTGLPGAANDVAMMARVLGQTFGVREEDIDRCVDDDATAAEMRLRLERLRDATGPDDTALVYFTGHSLDTAGPDEPFLIGYDDHRDGMVGITPAELAAALEIPAREVVLVLDTHVARSFLDLIESRRSDDLTVLLACGVGELAYEMMIDGEQHGRFTAALAAELAGSERDITYGVLAEAVRCRVQADSANRAQTPQHVGPADARLFAGRFPLAGLWTALGRRVPRQHDEAVLRRALYQIDDQRARWALGRLALASGDVRRAADLLAAAAKHAPEVHLDLALALGELASGQTDAAARVLRALAEVAGGGHPDRLERAASMLEQPATGPPRVAVIAPSRPVVAAVAHQQWVDELVTGLAVAFDLDVSEVVVLSGADATVGETRDLLHRWADPSARETAIIVYDGAIGFDEGYQYQLADGFLPVADVRAIAGHTADMVVLLKVASTAERDLGQVTTPPIDDFGFDLVVLAAEATSLDMLVDAARDVWREHRTYGEWIAGIAGASVLPPAAESLSVRDRGAWIAARQEILGVQRAGADEALQLARAAIGRRQAQHEEHPVGHLAAGLALAAAGRASEALAELRTARNLYDDVSVMRVERLSDASAERWQMEARYHYGRLQYEHGDDLYDAVATLQAAQRRAPDDPRLLLHLARAIRALVERESLVEARRYARKYLELGAPLGGAADLREFVTANR